MNKHLLGVIKDPLLIKRSINFKIHTAPKKNNSMRVFSMECGASEANYSDQMKLFRLYNQLLF